MKSIIETLLLLGFLLNAICVFSQEPTQTIRGTVTDKESNITLIGAEVAVLSIDPVVGDVTDSDGHFKIGKIPVGRHTIQVSYLGYEPMTVPNLLVTAGKELVLNLELVESAVQLEVATVIAKHDKAEALNEMATVSARSFSVEETSRYAGSFYDPARMATNYAGVAVGSSDDLSNEIVVRGNSPSGILWRLEGVEIPNPNHFGSMGGSGGGISMLSSSTLSNSDFYTGAFPSEFGNALSGVFDLNLRNGNNEKREYAIMFGALGLEGAAEGPFRKGGQGSYLINYRYATLGLLAAAGINIAGDVTPKYSDVSFKMNMPTQKAGTFAIFGLAGQNSVQFSPKKTVSPGRASSVNGASRKPLRRPPSASRTASCSRTRATCAPWPWQHGRRSKVMSTGLTRRKATKSTWTLKTTSSTTPIASARPTTASSMPATPFGREQCTVSRSSPSSMTTTTILTKTRAMASFGSSTTTARAVLCRPSANGSTASTTAGR
ncbi:MAG: carboxypeptidase-like regulatory domain-containing protein [Saprospiraceae bacterium]|nr:carboxypeptidase-like regulatory domain-containing protein [Saprospiraceae bacterium]